MIHFEQNTATMWEKNWGFMKDIYPEGADAKPSNDTKLPPINGATQNVTVTPYPIRKHYMQDPATENYLITYNTEAIRHKYDVMDKYRFPCTTSNEIGWKWHNHKLERFGSHAKGKRNISRWWAGSLESMP